MNNNDACLVKNCRYCNNPLDDPFLKLGDQPLANNLVKAQNEDEFTCDLNLTLCNKCGLTQLSHIAPPDLMFKHYLYVSSTTNTFREHFASYAKDLKSKVQATNTIFAVDIGSNDGLLVKCYMNEGMTAIGVDPAENLATEANKNGIPTINQYFDESCVNLIINNHGKADIISANNVFAHIPDIQSVLSNVKKLLNINGIFVIEFPYYSIMQRDLVFDMIYHEHVSYINLNPLKYFIERNGLRIFDIVEVDSHGGSLRVFISWPGSSYSVNTKVDEMLKKEKEQGANTVIAANKFKKNVVEIRKKLWSFIEKAKTEQKVIAGYGAPAKASTIINFCKFTTNEIQYIIDDNPLKQGMLIPGAHIPIKPSSYLQEEKPDLLIIFAWNFAKEIVNKNEDLRNNGVDFIIPIPDPKIL